MAHVGQELGFGAPGRLGGNAGGEQVPVGPGEFVLQVLGAQGGTEPGPQFGRLEGFGEVINGSQLEAPELVARAVPGGQHHHRDGLGVRSGLELPQQFKPVHARQPQVQEDQIHGGLADKLEGCRSVFGAGECNLVLVQQDAEQFGHPRIIFDQQNVGGGDFHSCIPIALLAAH